MVAQFFSKLSQNYIDLLNDGSYHDIVIKVGEDPNTKIFPAHMNILCYRSPYLRQILASSQKDNNNYYAQINITITSPEIFRIILEYIYGGIISLDDKNDSDLLKILAAADKFNLQELVDYLQEYLIENRSECFCTNLVIYSPEKVLKSLILIYLPEKSLISIIEKDDLQMTEIEVWEHVLRWGLAQNPTLIPDPNNWSDENFITMRNTLQHCLPLVRFFCLSPKEFSQKVRPYQKLLDQQLYNDLLNFYLEPDSVSSHNIQRPRKVKINEIGNEVIICSQIVDSDIISTISRWIDKMNINNNNFEELYLPYNFELLLRGNAILSNVKIKDAALWFNDVTGPYFGNDIVIYSSNNNSQNYDVIYYKEVFYEKKIRDSENGFTIEDYERIQRFASFLWNGILTSIFFEFDVEYWQPPHIIMDCSSGKILSEFVTTAEAQHAVHTRKFFSFDAGTAFRL
ncbi:BTB/POZ protein [Rhizophagus clarus]|uniref:BTB/POZ protein n=1 Tax=Rhizophagus clarus TaxID=94130 RepID=A0A8H3QY32_9GLOM|nr:BTB/POZ protein [Rhizophagus clarus]